MLRNIIFVDTGAIYAICNKSDKHHREAVKFASSLPSRQKLVISNYVFVETWSLLNTHLGWSAALAFYNVIVISCPGAERQRLTIPSESHCRPVSFLPATKVQPNNKKRLQNIHLTS